MKEKVGKQGRTFRIILNYFCLCTFVAVTSRMTYFLRLTRGQLALLQFLHLEEYVTLDEAFCIALVYVIIDIPIGGLRLKITSNGVIPRVVC